MISPPKTALSFVDEQLTLYCESATSNEPIICCKIREAAALHPKSHWIAGPLVGTLLKLFVSVMGAKRVLDIGTFLGYSAAYMATAGRDVRVISLEHNIELASQARALLDTASVGKQIRVEISDAYTWLMTNPNETFDLVFFDSNRTNLMRAYDQLLRTIRPGGVLVMDNACLRRKVLAPGKPWEHDTACFNARIQQDQSFLTTLLPVRDGVLIGYKLPVLEP